MHAKEGEIACRVDAAEVQRVELTQEASLVGGVSSLREGRTVGKSMGAAPLRS